MVGTADAKDFFNSFSEMSFVVGICAKLIGFIKIVESCLACEVKNDPKEQLAILLRQHFALFSHSQSFYPSCP